MPELPEVETVRRGLDSLIRGWQVTGVEALNPKSFPVDPDLVPRHLAGRTIQGVGRRAKLLVIALEQGWNLAVHLKMTGQLVFREAAGMQPGREFGAGHPSDSLIGRLPDRSTRIVFSLAGPAGQTAWLYFNDQRKFGWIKLLDDQALEELDFVRTLGPEPLDAGFTLEDFRLQLARRSGRRIKASLLDQSCIAGIGNIYADEALWLAGIHPETRVAQLDAAAQERLYGAVRAALQAGIDAGGSSSRNYVDAEGRRGTYLDFAAVYGRSGQACRRCGQQIIKIRSAGRGTHLCPACQPDPAC